MFLQMLLGNRPEFHNQSSFFFVFFFCKTGLSLINDQLVESIYTLNLWPILGTYSLVQINKRGSHIIFFLFFMEK